MSLLVALIYHAVFYCSPRTRPRPTSNESRGHCIHILLSQPKVLRALGLVRLVRHTLSIFMPTMRSAVNLDYRAAHTPMPHRGRAHTDSMLFAREQQVRIPLWAVSSPLVIGMIEDSREQDRLRFLYHPITRDGCMPWN